MKKTYEAKGEKPASARQQLPVGSYVAKIIGAKVESTPWGGERLSIAFDIEEGTYKGFFKADFDENTANDKKWRGTFRQNVPTGDGSERDGWTQRSFNTLIWALEASNKGYVFDWDESKFKGKLVGVSFRNEEWEINGRTGWTTRCWEMVDVETVRAGKARIGKDKPLNKSSSESAQADFPVVEAASDDDLPF